MSSRDRLEEFERAMEKVKELSIGDIKELWIDYDKHNDILYIGFGREEAEESIMVDDDVVVGLKGRNVVGITIFSFTRKAGIEVC
ncbi:MAG: DUF2283 domain-containing protein [Desulfurococcales archaeon]|nr:DUF2283 domain-containing protein [Desulfurococcales archaeon]